MRERRRGDDTNQLELEKLAGKKRRKDRNKRLDSFIAACIEKDKIKGFE